ncbi:MAG: DNA/RNA nuclease SfsA [Pseudomonadota bacterium]
MDFPSPLTKATLIKRYKRFLADLTLADGTEVTAHCANPGSMMGVAPTGATAWLSWSDSKTRKLPWSLELVEVDNTLVAINTNNPNKIGTEAIKAGLIPPLSGYETLRREVKYSVNSRIDILLNGPGKPDCYVEIKNVHLMRTPGLAEFPDSVTSRGAKHLGDLSAMVAAGHRAVMLYIVQRGDCDSFALARDLDPAYGKAMDAARAAGVDVLCYDCDVSVSGVTARRPLPVEF